MKLLSTVKSAFAGAMLGFRAGWGSFSEATAPTTDRGANYMVWLDADTRQYLDTWTRKQILQKVEWLFQNFGIVKEAVRGIARLTIGKGICLQINTDDEEWNALAEQQFEDWAMSPSRCDLAGRRTFYEMQNHAVAQRLKAGEFFAAFTTNPRWEGAPCLQLFAPLEIETPDSQAENPLVCDGIRLDKFHCPVGYFVRTLDGGSKEIAASEMVHWYHADETNQVRGVSDFAQAVAPLANAKELMNIVTKTAKQNTAIGLHIKKMVKNGGQGGLDVIRTLAQRKNVANGNAAGPAQTTPSTDPDPAHERLVGGGAIIYTDTEGDVKVLKAESPSPLVEPYITKVLMRDGLASAGIPSELFWECGNLNSANQRFVLVKGEATFTTLSDGCEGRLCNPAAVRFLQHRIDTKALRLPRRRVVQMPDPTTTPIDPADMAEPVETWVDDTENHWMQCLTWQRPAKLTIDNGRDAAAEISQLTNGIETLATINDRRGRGWRPMVKQWFREFAFAFRCAKEAGVPWAIKLWRATMPGAGAATPEDPKDEGEPKKEKPAEE